MEAIRWKFVLLGGALLGVACGGKIGEAVRPPDPTAAQAMGAGGGAGGGGGACSVESSSQPLVIDLPSTDRTDLEAGMKRGIVVVSYDCKQLKIVKGCTLPGRYVFGAVVPKEDQVQIDNADALFANMPISAVKLEAEVKAGSSIDLLLVTVGQKGSTLMTATRGDLQGGDKLCKGATHFLRTAYLGGFTMSRKTSGLARGGASGLGMSAGGSSSSDKNMVAHDGVLDVCRKSSAEAENPPPECQSPLSVELVPVDADRTPSQEEATEAAKEPGGKETAKTPDAPAPDAKDGAPAKRCGANLVWTGAICDKPSTTAPHLCKANDAADCKAQCDRGHAASCTWLGHALAQGTGGAAKDEAAAQKVLEKACTARDPRGCLERAQLALRAAGTTKDATARGKLETEARGFGDRACAMGDGWACMNVASWYRTAGPRQDLAKAASMMKRSCDFGYAFGCLRLAEMIIAGEGVPKDGAKARDLLGRACESGKWDHCERLGDADAKGELGAKDEARALGAYEKACSLGGSRACAKAGMLVRAKEPARARELFARGCTDKVKGWDACLGLGDAYEHGVGGTPDKPKAAEVYERGCMYGGCARAAALWERGDGVPADAARALGLYEQACKRANEHAACTKWASMLEGKDKESAKAAYLDLCTRQRDAAACASAKRLGAAVPAGIKPVPPMAAPASTIVFLSNAAAPTAPATKPPTTPATKPPPPPTTKPPPPPTTKPPPAPPKKP